MRRSVVVMPFGYTEIPCKRWKSLEYRTFGRSKEKPRVLKVSQLLLRKAPTRVSKCKV